MEIKINDEIVLTCIEGMPVAAVIKIMDDCVVLQESAGRLFIVKKEHIVQGFSTVQALDFDSEIEIPNGNDLPDFIKRHIIEVGNIDHLKTVKHQRLGANMSSLKIEFNSEGNATYNGILVDDLMKFVTECIKDEDGMQHGMMMVMSGDKPCLAIASLHIDSYQVFESMKNILDSEVCLEIAFTVCQKNGCAGAIVEDCTAFQKIYAKMGQNWWYGILPFKIENGKAVFGEVDWANDIWTERMELDLLRAGIIKSKNDIVYGTAFDDKIEIKSYTENSHGYFYEGTINQNKMTDKVKSFLDKYKLDVNDRELVNEQLKILGNRIVIEKDNFGFYTVRCRSFFASERRSKTRAYIEALEYLA